MRYWTAQQDESSNERGSALILVLIISTVLLLIGLAVSFVATAEIRISSLDRDHKAARYVAELGLKQAEAAMFASWTTQQWDDDLDDGGGLGRPAHADGGDQMPWSLNDNSLDRNGLIVYRWTDAGAVDSALYQVPVNIRGGNNARYTVWVRNNRDDYSASINSDLDSIVDIIALGEVLDISGGVRARSFLAETISPSGQGQRNYDQKGFGAAGASTIEE